MLGYRYLWGVRMKLDTAMFFDLSCMLLVNQDFLLGARGVGWGGVGDIIGFLLLYFLKIWGYAHVNFV